MWLESSWAIQVFSPSLNTKGTFKIFLFPFQISHSPPLHSHTASIYLAQPQQSAMLDLLLSRRTHTGLRLVGVEYICARLCITTLSVWVLLNLGWQLCCILTSLFFFPRWFSTSTSLGGRKLLKLLARFLCPTCNGCSVSSENPFWWALWWVHSPTPNASLQLPTEGKDSFLDTKQRCQSTDCPLSVCGTPTHSRDFISPRNVYKNLCEQIPLHSLKTHSALETCDLASQSD